MTLFDSMFSTFSLYEYTTTPDGEGGMTHTYTNSGTVEAAIAFPSTQEQTIAEGLKANSTVTALFRSGANVVRDNFLVSDSGVIYRVTSNPQEKTAPSISTLPIMQADLVKVEAMPK